MGQKYRSLIATSELVWSNFRVRSSPHGQIRGQVRQTKVVGKCMRIMYICTLHIFHIDKISGLSTLLCKNLAADTVVKYQITKIAIFLLST